jgi:hypothetical protein
MIPMLIPMSIKMSTPEIFGYLYIVNFDSLIEYLSKSYFMLCTIVWHWTDNNDLIDNFMNIELLNVIISSINGKMTYINDWISFKPVGGKWSLYHVYGVCIL